MPDERKPSKAWYLVGFGLWVVAWVGIAGASYSVSILSDDELATLQRIGVGSEPTEVEWGGGDFIVFVERAPGTTAGSGAPDSVADLADEVDVVVVTESGSVLQLREQQGFRYESANPGADGWSILEAESLPAGSLQVSAATTGATVSAIAVGAEPERSFRSLWIWGALALMAIVEVIVVARVRRRRG